MLLRLSVVVLVLVCAITPAAFGSTLTLNGTITQSTPDGTGPASANPSLNNIADAELFTLALVSPTAINGPGTYDLTGSSLTFSVPDALATESSFDSISLTVTADGAFSDFSLLACLSGADCFSGNALTANFEVLTSLLGGSAVSVTNLDQPHPFDLLEDGGTTDIQGAFTAYSGDATSSSAVTPEPASGSLFAAGLSAMALIRSVRHRFANPS